MQALEGKDVKDLLSAVGSGGGAAAPAAGGAAAAGAAPEEAKEEAKEEGTYLRNCILVFTTLTFPQRRRSPTRTWASVSSTKHPTTIAKKKVAALWAFPRNPDDLCAYMRRASHDHCSGGGGGRRRYPGPCSYQRAVPYRLGQ